MKYWVLNDDHSLRLTDDLLAWARMFEDGTGRTVAKDTIGEARVSTVFLGIDHNFGDGPPAVFETMIFGGPFDEYTWRYATWAEAEAGHRAVVEALRTESPLPR